MMTIKKFAQIEPRRTGIAIFIDHQCEQRSVGPAIPVAKQVDGLKLIVDHQRPDQRIGVPFGLHLSDLSEALVITSHAGQEAFVQLAG